MKTPQKPLFLQFSKAIAWSTPSIVQMKKNMKKNLSPYQRSMEKRKKDFIE